MSRNKELFKQYCRYLGKDSIEKKLGFLDDYEEYVIVNQNQYYSEVMTYSSGVSGDNLYLEILLNKKYFDLFKTPNYFKGRFYPDQSDSTEQRKKFKEKFKYIKIFFKCMDKQEVSDKEITILVNNKDKLTENGIKKILPYLI